MYRHPKNVEGMEDEKNASKVISTLNPIASGQIIATSHHLGALKVAFGREIPYFRKTWVGEIFWIWPDRIHVW